MNKAFCTGIRERTISILSGIKAGTFERDEAIALSLLSAMAGESIFLLGLPGVGKSMIARRLKLAFKDASVFEYLMSRFSTPDEIFGPILRGRDIRRYSYDWAGLYLIATFPSRHYDIEEYPAVKQYLLSFGKERLEQTGREYVLNGQRIKSRKKTNNKWFETQDSIGYWEDFFKPKIIYPNMTQFMPFVYDEMSFLTNQKCFILTGENSAFLTAFFNSELFKLCFKDNFPRLGDKGRELSKIFFDRIPVIQVSEVVNDEFKQLLRQIQEAPDNEEISALIEKRLSEVYNLTSAEIETVSSMKI